MKSIDVSTYPSCQHEIVIYLDRMHPRYPRVESQADDDGRRKQQTPSNDYDGIAMTDMVSRASDLHGMDLDGG